MSKSIRLCCIFIVLLVAIGALAGCSEHGDSSTGDSGEKSTPMGAAEMETEGANSQGHTTAGEEARDNERTEAVESEEGAPLTLKDLTVNFEGVDSTRLLEDWKWLLPTGARPVLVTAMGDVFVQAESGSVHFLDTYAGSVAKVSDDGDEFRALLRDVDFVTDHMYPDRFAELVDAGMVLQPGQCYDFKFPGVLGGEDAVENMEMTDLVVHFSIMGQIHEQVKDLPEGTPIDKFVFKGMSDDGA